MNALFAAGLFDNPWVVLAILIGGALANWLAKRRQENRERQAGQPPEKEEPSPPARTPPSEFNLEETLRRLLGEEPPPAPAPPLIPRAALGELPPAQPSWSDEERLPTEPARQPAKPPLPVLRPPIVVPPINVTVYASRKEVEPAEQRFEQLTEQVRQPAKVVSHKHQLASRSRPRSAARWRDARSVRQAFAASLVFAPPKSLEP